MNDSSIKRCQNQIHSILILSIKKNEKIGHLVKKEGRDQSLIGNDLSVATKPFLRMGGCLEEDREEAMSKT